MVRRQARPQPIRIDGRDYLSTAQTADYLGVRVETVYAYVSRGVLHRTVIADRRGSFFALAHVEDVAARGRAPRSAGPERIHTHITLLDGDVLRYRGRDVAELVEGETTFEQVCALLWDVSVATPFQARPHVLVAAARARTVMPQGAHPLDLLKVSVALAGAADAGGSDLRPAAVAATGASLLATMCGVLDTTADSTDPTDSIAGQVCRAVTTRSDADAVRLVDTALCLLADHDLATSTRAVRVAGSARADPYAAVAAGLGAFDSPLHGTASRPACRLITDVVQDRDRTLADVLRARHAAAPLPPGFGHRVYREQDPRAEVLLARLTTTHPGHPALVAVDHLRDALSPWPQAFANIDLAVAALMHVLDADRDAGDLLFAIARTAGWIAHLIEEYAAEPLRYRVIGVYAGIRP